MTRSLSQSGSYLAILMVILLTFLGVGTLLVKVEHRHNATSVISNYDVVVVGAGPGGIAASIQAAKMGEKVALLEQTDWLGGQMTAAGVGTMDEDNPLARQSGIYKNFVDRVNDYYASRGKSVSTCYFGTKNLCVDPSVGQQVLHQMLNDEGGNVQVFTGVKVVDVLKQGATVIGVTTDRLGVLKSKVVIDADEYGDILGLAGVPFRLGKSISGSPNRNSCVQTISYAAIIKFYPQGVPENLTFMRPPPGYTGSLINHFKKYLAINGYDHLKDHKQPYTFQSYAAFRGLPDLTNPQDYNALQQNGHIITRTALILGNDFPLDARLNSLYISDPALRVKDTCQAKLLTLQLVYYIQHDLHQTKWSIADDEGYDTTYARQNHCPELNGYEAFEYQMAQEPYVREARRIIGVETLTSASMLRPWSAARPMPTFKDSIAVGYYPMDLHGCNRASDLEPGLDAPTALTSVSKSGPFEVPIGVLIPQRVDGMLAAEKNISVSRLADGAIREQPIVMSIGQAAGALAALAVKRNEQPRYVPYQDVQRALAGSGAVIYAK